MGVDSFVDSEDEVLIIKTDTPCLVDLTSDDEMCITTITIDDTLISVETNTELNVSPTNSLRGSYANDVLNVSSYDSVLDTESSNIVSTPVRDSPFTFSIDRTPNNLIQLNPRHLSIIPGLYSQSESVEPRNHEEPKGDRKRKFEDSPSTSDRDLKILKKKPKKQIPELNNVVLEEGISSENVSNSANGHHNRFDIPETPFIDLCDELDSFISKPAGLRHIVLDGCNIAFCHGALTQSKRVFSAMGIKICVDFFVGRGHEVVAVLPIRFKRNCDNKENTILLEELEGRGLLTFVPFRKLDGRPFAVYDDIYMVQYAQDKNAIIISKDNYCDLAYINEEWRQTISERVIPFTFIGDDLIFPYRPLGPNGPLFEEMLRL